MSTGTELTRTEGKDIEQANQRTVVTPLVDIYENADEVLVVADVPGVASDGVNLRFENNQLTIHASAREPDIEGTPLFREFDSTHVDYRRAFELAPGIDGERISAELHHGTLMIHLPKPADMKPRQIPISAS
jgi:HSP20 family molecular chaperone IbpA